MNPSKITEHPDKVEAGLEKGTDIVPKSTIGDMIQGLRQGIRRALTPKPPAEQPSAEAMMRTISDIQRDTMRGY